MRSDVDYIALHVQYVKFLSFFYNIFVFAFISYSIPVASIRSGSGCIRLLYCTVQYMFYAYGYRTGTSTVRYDSTSTGFHYVITGRAKN
jgi:hypothetical protein